MALVILFLMYLSGDDTYTNDETPYIRPGTQSKAKGFESAASEFSLKNYNALDNKIGTYEEDADFDYSRWEEVDIVLGEKEQLLLDEVDMLLKDAEDELDSVIDLSLNVEKLEIEQILKRANIDATEEQEEDVINEVYARAESKILRDMGDDIEDVVDMEIDELEKDEKVMEMEKNDADSIMQKLDSEGEILLDEVDEVANSFLENTREDITSILLEIVKDVVQETFHVEIDLENPPDNSNTQIGDTNDYDENEDGYSEYSEDGEDVDINAPGSEDYESDYEEN